MNYKANDLQNLSYRNVVETIEHLPRFPGHLKNLEAYLDRFDHPERRLRVIHVAGTNGKGSVCAFMSSVLEEAGFRTAMFTSPHLLTLRERFVIGGSPVPEQRVIDAYLRIVKAEQEEGSGLQRLAFFEMLFLMSLLIFEEDMPDYCLMETGLGGRLDPTVLCEPVLCVISSISLDHTEILGGSVPEIAGEKAGIIKAGIPVVIIDEHHGELPVIQAEAEKKGSPLYVLDSEKLLILKKSENKIDFSIDKSYYNFSVLSIKGKALYQVQNGALSALAAKILLPHIPDHTIAKGLEHMRWTGRMQEILPGVYADGAHNPGAVDKVVSDLELSSGKWKLLFAVYDDKDYHKMIRRLCDYPFEQIYVSGMQSRRGAPGRDLFHLFKKYCECPVICLPDVRSAFEAAVHELKHNECLLCLGSLRLVSEILEITEAGTFSIEREGVR